MLKTMIAGMMLCAAATTSWATQSTSWFATTPRCCNRAAIRTDVLTDSWSRIIGTRFEYFRLKNDGTCQHVKQTTGRARISGYVHIWEGRATANKWFETSMAECCGSPVGSPFYWNQNCGIQVFTGLEPAGSFGIPLSVQ